MTRTAAIFCAHFLPRDQNHVYRQVDGLPGWDTRVLSWKRENTERFPFPAERIEELGRPWSRELRRCWYKQIRAEPWRIGAGEASKIAGKLKQADASILHIYFGHVGIHLLPLMERRSLPTLVSFHGVDAAVEVGSVRHQLLRRVFEHSTLLPARSHELLGKLESLGAPVQKLRLWRAGVSLADWPLVPRLVPESGAWILAQACRFQEKKGLDTSLKAFAELRSRWPQIQLVLAGDGPCREMLESTAHELGIGDAVEWPGFLDQGQLRALYKRAHILLHPSRTTSKGDREGVPNAMLEAMATGLPIAATRHGGIPEALAGTDSVLVEEDDAAALAAGIEHWFLKPLSWSGAAAGTRRAVEQGFDLAVQRSRIAELYQEAATTFR